MNQHFACSCTSYTKDCSRHCQLRRRRVRHRARHSRRNLLRFHRLRTQPPHRRRRSRHPRRACTHFCSSSSDCRDRTPCTHRPRGKPGIDSRRARYMRTRCPLWPCIAQSRTARCRSPYRMSMVARFPASDSTASPRKTS